MGPVGGAGKTPPGACADCGGTEAAPEAPPAAKSQEASRLAELALEDRVKAEAAVTKALWVE